MGEAEDKIRTHVKKGLAELEALRDAVRDKIGEAGHEAKDAWKTLEPKVVQTIADLEQAAKNVGKDLATGLDAAVDEVKTAFAELKKKL
jgi:hypothetical protein